MSKPDDLHEEYSEEECGEKSCDLTEDF